MTKHLLSLPLQVSKKWMAERIARQYFKLDQDKLWIAEERMKESEESRTFDTIERFILYSCFIPLSYAFNKASKLPWPIWYNNPKRTTCMIPLIACPTIGTSGPSIGNLAPWLYMNMFAMKSDKSNVC